MEEYKVWAYARSAVPNLTALENQLEEVMREADKRGYTVCYAQSRAAGPRQRRHGAKP